MRKRIVALLTGISMAALLASGCANKEAVKKEEPVVPAASAGKVVPASPSEVAKAAETAKAAEKANEVKAAQAEVAKKDALQNAKDASAEIKFEAVYFDFDKSDLRQDARDVLSKNAAIILKSTAPGKIQVEGHCDDRGSAEYNMALGEKRAKSALKYLTTLGVNAEKLSVISYGKEKPAVKGDDEAAWAKNRRAEFAVIK